MSTQADHPVFPNPSIALVVLEVRFPPTTTKPDVAQAELRAGLRQHYPLAEQFALQNLTVDLASGGNQLESGLLLRYSSRDRTASVAISPDAVIIETSRYLGFAWYQELLREPIRVVADVLQPDGIVGMGHRFIDEVRVPSKAGPIDWARWINGELLAPSRIPEAAGAPAPSSWQGLIHYQVSPESALTLRYGPSAAAAVPANGSTRRERPAPPGPMFLLDWDSRLTPAVVSELTVDHVLDQCASLYEPVRAMFHHLTTDDLRAEFANERREED